MREDLIPITSGEDTTEQLNGASLVHNATKELLAAMPETLAAEDDVDLTGIEKVNRFPHGLSQRR